MPGEHTPHMPPSPVEEHAIHLNVVGQLESRQGAEHIDPHSAWQLGSTALALAAEVGGGYVEARNQARDESEALWQEKSPFRPENAAAFGSEADRLSAAERVREMANQALLTNKFVDGRQKQLAAQLRKGEISEEMFADASGAIMTGLALMNPKKLEQIQAAQAKVIAKRIKAGKLPPETQAVNLTSQATENGMQLAGIDAVAAKLAGVTSSEELRYKGLEIKRRTYGEAAFKLVKHRFRRREAELAVRIFEVQDQRHQTEVLLNAKASNGNKKKLVSVGD
ncbi:MAG TPA: hypothetical protein VD735_06770 [Candidatus Saccharimonadales bacterium]|nr:hypothetical protein [Candidatus Saccharimonadales bacterium]